MWRNEFESPVYFVVFIFTLMSYRHESIILRSISRLNRMVYWPFFDKVGSHFRIRITLNTITWGRQHETPQRYSPRINFQIMKKKEWLPASWRDMALKGEIRRYFLRLKNLYLVPYFICQLLILHIEQRFCMNFPDLYSVSFFLFFWQEAGTLNTKPAA